MRDLDLLTSSPGFSGYSTGVNFRRFSAFSPWYSAMAPKEELALNRILTRTAYLIQEMKYLHRRDPIQLWIPHKGQLEAITDAAHDIVIVAPANRWGKTDMMLSDASLWLTNRHP